MNGSLQSYKQPQHASFKKRIAGLLLCMATHLLTSGNADFIIS